MRKETIITILIVSLLVVGIYLIETTGQSNNTDASDFDRVADIELTDYDGNSIRLDEFRGKPLVINSWATWCPFCLAELPDFGRLQTEYRDQIKVIAINRRESPQGVQAYTDDVEVTDKLLFLLDDDDSFYQTIGGFSMPETIFVNASGEIVVHKRGPMELDEMQEHTEKIINSN